MGLSASIATGVRAALTSLANDGLTWCRPPSTTYAPLVGSIHLARSAPWMQDNDRDQTTQPQDAFLKVPDDQSALLLGDRVKTSVGQVWVVTGDAVQTQGQRIYTMRSTHVLKGKPDRHGAP
jgi:hypothetical protein